MQPITVAIAGENAERRTKIEHYLQGEQDISVLTNAASMEGEMSRNRRLYPRTNMTPIENVVAMTRRLNPRILFANMKQCTEADGAMLLSLRRECPGTLVVLLADESVQQENLIMQALARGARGYLNLEADPIHISKIVHVIDRGEAWVPRKMLGKIMDQMLHWCHGGTIQTTH